MFVSVADLGMVPDSETGHCSGGLWSGCRRNSRIWKEWALEVVVGEVEAEEATQGGEFRWDFARDVIVGEMEELEIEVAGERAEGVVKAVVVKVEEAELVKGGEGVDEASELSSEVPEIPLLKCSIRNLIEITR